ncbi:hypothetical protein B9Z65_7688 [Elsinoe australis]|uniref:Swiss Army Knife RNA repair protein HAD domain-containing protein n=1 Tax=Elsinoe australis TaxID=40998 RepID=A0A2P8A083_9PEZI|nr:hypothetical protein B9Z65_7688 [Elsinoe australis]
MSSLRDNFTPTALSRWSSIQKQLPSIDNISEVNVFDFDNTLFRTPLPNPQIWDGRSIGILSTEEAFINGGWWHDNSLLSSLGGGIQVQEPKAWEGYWDEHIVDLVRESMKSPTALTVLMTGRGQANFSELIHRMVESKGLDFDMIVLKPKVGPDGTRYSSTLDFKKDFFRIAMLTYQYATELMIYEDRPKQALGFEQHLAQLNDQWKEGSYRGNPSRDPVRAEVVLVEPRLAYFDTQLEIDQIMRMIDANNLAVKMGRGKQSARVWNMIKSRIYTGYLVQPEDSQRLLKLVDTPDSDGVKECRMMADNIMISFRPPRDDIIRRAGGWSAHRKWRVNGIGSHNNCIWAARLAPADPHLSVYTESFTPMIVLKMRKSVKASEANRIHNWVDIPEWDERAIIFDSVVQDKVVIKLLEAPENGYYTADGRVASHGDMNGHSPTSQYRGFPKRDHMQQRRAQHHPAAGEQSSADSSDAGADPFPPLAKAVQQQGQGQGHQGGRRRGGNRGQQGGQHQNQNQQRGGHRNYSGGPQHGQGDNQHGHGGRHRQGRGGRGGGRGGQGRSGQYRSLDDAGAGDAGQGSAAGMMY